MDTLFPLGFPWQTSFYLTLYLVTLALHMVFMNYVVAGTSVLFFHSFTIFRKRQGEQTGVVGALLNDWMPFALGGAITAGVAPLLFIQILYRDSFYTANLLLFHRWMAILPVLIVGFYLLYILKSKWIERRPAFIRGLVVTGAMMCFLFVGYSWTENHLLANRNPGTWAEFYQTGRIFYFDQTLISRLLVWFFGAFPTMWIIVGWQLRNLQVSASQTGEAGAAQRLRDNHLDSTGVAEMTSSPPASQGTRNLFIAIRRVGRNALLSLVMTLVAAISYIASLSSEVQAVLFSPMISPYLLVAVLGFALQFIGWRRVFVSDSLQHGHLIWITSGLALTMFSLLIQREAIRLAQIDISNLYARHAEAAQVGGLFAFLIFVILNSALIVWCIRLVAKEQKVPLDQNRN
jgi:hypothetical protein